MTLTIISRVPSNYDAFWPKESLSDRTCGNEQNQEVSPTSLDAKTRSASGPSFLKAWLPHHHAIVCLRCPLYFADLGLTFKRNSLILQTLQTLQCSYFVTVTFWWHRHPQGMAEVSIRCSIPVCPSHGHHAHSWGGTYLRQCVPPHEALAQRDCDACLMTGLETLFLETLGLTPHCHPWNLPKGSMLSLATGVSLMTLEYTFSLLSRAPNTLPQSIRPPSTCYSAKRHTHCVDAHSFLFPCPWWGQTSSF